MVQYMILYLRYLYSYIPRRSSFLFYMQAALAGIELGYFNAGFLCNELKELHYKKSNNCIEELLNRYLMVHGQSLNIDSYALLNVAEYYQWKKRNFTKAIELYVQLYRNGDGQVTTLTLIELIEICIFFTNLFRVYII